MTSDMQKKALNESNAHETYNSMLHGILALTDSQYGFMGEVFTINDLPFLKIHAQINRPSDKRKETESERSTLAESVLLNLNCFGNEGFKTGIPIIINESADILETQLLPKGHPKINNFAGIPLLKDDQMIGLIGLCNRKEGYDDNVVAILQPIVSTVTTVMEIFRNKDKRKSDEDALRKSENLFRNVFELAPCGKSIVLPNGRFWMVNKAFCDMLGFDHSQLIKKSYSEVTYSEDIVDSQELVRSLLAGEAVYKNIEKRYVRSDGKAIWADVRTSLLRDDSGKPLYIVTVANDINDRKRMEQKNNDLEAQLHQAQKMESVGRLAGGVAHDFNNLLSVIIGYSELMAVTVPEGHPNKTSLDEIHHAGLRAKGLTRQLLAFARKQVLEVKMLDLNEVIKGFESIIRRLIDEDIRLGIKLAPDSLPIYADNTQLEQILMNLVVNAKDAMPNGGLLLIETNCVEIGDEYAEKKPYVIPGTYAMLAVSDTGVGMDKQTIDKIFEPFFTTKGKEEGTGLGLSTVYGIVKQHNGNIWAYSEPGQGTTFKIYLPLVLGKSIVKPKVRENYSARNSATVLVVEDDLSVKRLACKMLSQNDQVVIESTSPWNALEIAANHAGTIDLLLTDVVMPGINGTELFDKVREFHPETKVLYMSGYTYEAISHKGVLAKGVHFIQKPFSSKELSWKISHILFS